MPVLAVRHGDAGEAARARHRTDLRTLAYEEALSYTRGITVEDLRKGYKNTKTTPLGRSGKLTEVANLVLFLASDRASYIHGVTYNVAGGKMAAEYLLEKIGNQGDVVELEGIPGASAARERGQGFHDVIDQAKDVKVVGRQPADFDRAKGLSVMENILQANKNVKGVFAHNDEMALGAVQALEAAGMKDVTVVGFDATDDAVNAVKAGKMSATVAQKPELIGKTAVDAAKKIIDGQPVDKALPVPLDLVKQ